MRGYLDEHLAEEIAVLAQRLGLDVLSSHAVGNDGKPDDVQLAFATAQGRCIVTNNHRDFLQLAQTYDREGRLHVGILPLSPSLPPSKGNYARIARALVYYNELYDGEDIHHVDWLRPAPGDV